MAELSNALNLPDHELGFQVSGNSLGAPRNRSMHAEHGVKAKELFFQEPAIAIRYQPTLGANPTPEAEVVATLSLFFHLTTESRQGAILPGP